MTGTILNAATGTVLNAAGILIGGILGLMLRKQLSMQRQVQLKVLMGALIVFVGLHMTWTSLGGGFWAVLKQFGIMLLALTIGNIIGKLLHIQKGVNRLGQMAAERLKGSEEKKTGKFGDAFITGALLFCVGPISILGALFDGLDGRWQTLGIKGLIDSVAVSVINCQSKGCCSNRHQGRNFALVFCSTSALQANSAIISTLSVGR